MLEKSSESLLELTPNGFVICRDLKKLPDFEKSEVYGLISLSGKKNSDDINDQSLHFWNDFSALFLKKICSVSDENLSEIETPNLDDFENFILNAPPMLGAEYLSIEVLNGIWKRLLEFASSFENIASFLHEKAPLWSRVGRITLHLAENKSDPEFPFAFMATYASELKKNGQIKQLPLGKALKEFSDDKKSLVKILSPLKEVSQKNEFMKELLETGDIFHPMTWLPSETYDFLCGIPDYEDCGLTVRIPDWWKKRTRRPQVAVTVGDQKSAGVGIGAMLQFRLHIEVNGWRLNKEQVEALLAGEDGLVMLRGEWIEVDREKLRQAIEHWEKIERLGGISFAEGMRMLAGAPKNLGASTQSEDHREWSFLQSGEWLSEVLNKLREPSQIAAPKSLKATLRPYQLVGLNWLWFCTQTGLGACLADDMGLGKTIQILALLLRKKEENTNSSPALLIVPASLIGNWKNEADKFAPSLKIHIAHNSADGIDEPKLENFDLIITTYGMLTRLDWISEKQWSLVIIDEAQAIKNHGTRQSRAVRSLQCDARIALTGTPIENRLSDLWSIFSFINPGLLGTYDQFLAFTKSLELNSHEKYAPLRKLVAPYILRRLKSDKNIIADLPDKTELKVYCGLSSKQSKLYQQSVQELLKNLKNEEESSIQRKGLVLSFLMRFKQICNHPDQATGQTVYDPADSAKFQRLETLCSEIASRGEKVLVFTQFKEITEPLSDCLNQIFGRKGLILHGGTPVKKRQEMVSEFQKENGPPFFVLSIKAGGTGLNLTAASHVIHFDRWWNPAIENQATDRAYRIGQKRNVLVHKFVTIGTLEEKIDKLISDKQNTADQILDLNFSEKMITEMNDKDLLELISIDLEKALI